MVCILGKETTCTDSRAKKHEQVLAVGVDHKPLDTLFTALTVRCLHAPTTNTYLRFISFVDLTKHPEQQRQQSKPLKIAGKKRLKEKSR